MQRVYGVGYMLRVASVMRWSHRRLVPGTGVCLERVESIPSALSSVQAWFLPPHVARGTKKYLPRRTMGLSVRARHWLLVGYPCGVTSMHMRHVRGASSGARDPLATGPPPTAIAMTHHGGVSILVADRGCALNGAASG
jgi:hypothetical protein